ncbi:activator of Hsp90 ATPase-like protein [Anseongella ginsenosidimutans]|uniref:Activator of Hsp90 ATPase-like protein n=1 Tax=Anseongella ginsenosidimutans TaxID=496056 RepID=A0A4R3KLP5_9SPHI|nr:SRPBCC domain-containing protein [Anseongella ginsenosidimutans]QEC51912.1 SRPBCC domain-containing protein [Anseongella ginsenosidimutans]TCS85063.1 activator of Hsp90 ATPase-like protein [Anseongella ginsenosidimutans]
MKNQDFTTTMVVEATPSEVFNAVNNVRGWWSENIEGATDMLNSEFSYHYQDVHRAKMKITDLVPGEVVVWHVLDNYFKFTTDDTEWKGTHVVFEISEKDGKTQLTFTHQGLVPEYECFKICQDAWTHYIQGSLKDLIEKGKGDPTPRDAGNESAETQSPEQQLSADQAATKSIYHRLLIESPVETIYKALTTAEGLAGWWTPDTTAKSGGDILRFAFGPDYFKEMKVEELKPYNKVKWLCLKGYEEWIDTTITFELEPHRKGSTLFFHHDNWKAATHEFAGCSYDWALFLRSLKLLCETGQGLPYPDFRN